MKKNSEIIILIPAYNPDQKMTGLIEDLSQEYEHIVVVNDGCSSEYDKVFDGLKTNGKIDGCVDIVVHEVNKGKGRALKTGYGFIYENYPDSLGVATVDADGQHTPKDVRRCIEKFYEDTSKAVFGCRDFSHTEGIPARSLFGNRVTIGLLKFFCDIRLTDSQTGLRILPTSSIPDMLEVAGERYEYEMNAIIAMKDIGLEVAEVPIEIIYINNNESSHFNPIRDSLRIYKLFGKFCLSSVGSALLDLAVFTILTFALKNIMETYLIQVSTVIARVCSGIFNFCINKWIFSSKKNKAKVSSSGPKYLLLWLVQMLLSAELVSLAAKWIPWNATVLKMLIDTVLFFISYKIQQVWVFKGKKEDG